MQAHSLIAASKDTDISSVCGLALIVGGAAFYLWSVFAHRNSLRAELKTTCTRLRKATEEIAALRNQISESASSAETKLAQHRTEVLREANDAIRSHAQQLSDKEKALEERIAAKESELNRRGLDLSKQAAEVAHANSRQLTEGEAKLARDRAKMEAEFAALAKSQASDMAAREAEIRASKAALDEKLTEACRMQVEWVDEISRLQAKLEGIHGAFSRDFLEGRQWLSKAYADLLRYHDDRHQWALALTAKPNTKVAAELTEVKRQRREVLQRNRFLEWQVSSYEEYFPILADYRDAILKEAVDLRGSAEAELEAADPALANQLLTKHEFDSLSSSEKYQLALDRYRGRPKSAWEVGRDYERQIGYQYESSGWRVEYHGALQGFEDLGRDLICQRGDELLIVQCKCWKEEREIRERHVFQLYGTSILRRLELGDKKVIIKPLFVTTGRLSDIAARAAAALGVEVIKVARRDYPLIKCNVNASTRDKIYHLPFDQQYDRILIGDQQGEVYVSTVAEAERLGFRRALRWSGPS